MKFPGLAKLAALGAVVISLLVGLGLVDDVVRDRQRYRDATAQGVADSLAGPQSLLGPIIHLACVESWDEATGTDAERRISEKRREFVLQALPDQLRLRTEALMEERARGVHKVNTYLLKARIGAQWAHLGGLQAQSTVKGSRMQCGSPLLMLAVGDTRGIRTATLRTDEQTLPLKPGTFLPSYPRGVHAALPDAVRQHEGPFEAELELELVGTERVSIVPLGGNTEVHMSSAWPHPSFAGRFLPSQRHWGPKGFEAQWRLSSLASTAQQDVLQGKKLCDAAPATHPYAPEAASPQGCADSFSVAFVDPVNPYSLADRAIKYGVLFIALTFVAVGLFEVLKKLRVHPVQYLLVGSALCSFFLLLVSLSEHLPFGISYAGAATACVLLLGYYASHILGSVARGLPLAGGIALLYGLLYLLLQLEQTALVVGSVALFAVLAAVMVATRKVDWYALGPNRALGAAARMATPSREAA